MKEDGSEMTEDDVTGKSLLMEYENRDKSLDDILDEAGVN